MIESLRQIAEKRRASVAACALLGTLGVSACGHDTPPPPGPGYDVSYPQCTAKIEKGEHVARSVSLPNNRSFAIVGLNAGKPLSRNPCFEEQLEWAQGSRGTKEQPKAGIYVVAANPGATHSKFWPSTGENKYGSCNGEDSAACAYEYGKGTTKWNINQVTDMGKKPKNYTWWLDVEYGVSWQCNKGVSRLCEQPNARPVRSGAYTRNAAVIEGMAAELMRRDIKVGIYTHPSHWLHIVNRLAKDTVLEGLPVWITGSAHEPEAQRKCDTAPFYSLGEVVLSQYNPDITFDFDKNLSCK